MAFDLKQSLKLSQQLLMTPQLQQAIKLLQLSRMELVDFVTEQLAENPILEEGVVESHEETIQLEKNAESTESQVVNDTMQDANIVDKIGDGGDDSWEAFSRHLESASPTASRKLKSDEDGPNYENMVSRVGTLFDYLMTQIGELDLENDEIRIAEEIIGNIDERGYFRGTIEEVATAVQLSQDSVEDILDVVQRLDPSGVGAQDLKECLLIQLRNERLKNGIVEKIVSDHMTELENRNFQAIAKAMKIPLEKVIANVQIISELEPVPGRQFGAANTQFVVPDIYVFKVADEWIVTLNEEGLPRLRVNETYEKMLGNLDSQSKGKEKEYLEEKLKGATWLIKSIQQRQRTIFKVTEKIVEKQMDFFELGVEHLKPMILRDIADEIGMHESTISRVTTNKFVHTPHGILELKFFFNSSVSRIGGDSMASASVKKIIGDMIREEDPKKPLADQKIVEILDQQGIQLARRTVAKYREQLGILPSSKRKKYY